MGEDMATRIIGRNLVGEIEKPMITPYEKADCTFLSNEEADSMRMGTTDQATALKLVERGRTSDVDLVNAMENKGNNTVGAAAAIRLSQSSPHKLLEYALRH